MLLPVQWSLQFPACGRSQQQGWQQGSRDQNPVQYWKWDQIHRYIFVDCSKKQISNPNYIGHWPNGHGLVTFWIFCQEWVLPCFRGTSTIWVYSPTGQNGTSTPLAKIWPQFCTISKTKIIFQVNLGYNGGFISSGPSVASPHAEVPMPESPDVHEELGKA